MILAKELRLKEKINNISKDKPGYYKWWCRKKELKLLLDSKYINVNYYKELIPHLTKKEINGDTYYYIYVGVAINESIKERLNWHINQHHTKSSVVSGFLSTLRTTLREKNKPINFGILFSKYFIKEENKINLKKYLVELYHDLSHFSPKKETF